MCLSPVEIVNPSKYVSLKYRDRFILQVPCGHCAECQSSNSLEWQYRTYVEFCDCLSDGGFAYFDTLTYNRKSLPHISDFVKTDYNFPCFNHKHVTDFFKKLRSRLSRAGYDDIEFKYFLSSEYGTNPRDGVTYRPHYHVVFFVDGDIDPLEFSTFVSGCWNYGRTDGFPYQSKYYVENHNTIKENNCGNILRTISYITKYVQKSCLLQSELDKRVSLIMKRIDSDFCEFEDFEEDKLFVFSDSPAGRKFRLQLNRSIQQFHRQSLHYGESYLSELDLDTVMRNGYLVMPSSKFVKIRVPIPRYYKRKLFYDLVMVDNTKLWQLNEIGLQYREMRKDFLKMNLASRFSCICEKYHLSINCNELADYVLNYRGRFVAPFESTSIQQRLNSIDFYNYVTPTDREHFGCVGLSKEWLGNTKKYLSESLKRISLAYFVKNKVYFDEKKESELAKIYDAIYEFNESKQKAFALKQRLMNIYRCFC